MKKLNSVIMDIQNLRGAELENDINEFEIDIIDILEDLKEYEVDMIIEEPLEDEEYPEEFEEVETEDIEEYFEWLESIGYIADVYDYKADNSYNWLAPVSNHFDFKMYELLHTGGTLVDELPHTGGTLVDELTHTGGTLVEMKVHRYGDVRGNYTETFLLEFDNDYTFLETISENSKLVTIEVDEENYDVMVNPFSDVMEVMDEYGTLITETCETEKKYIIEEIKEAVAQ